MSNLSERLHPDSSVYVHYVVCRYISGEAENRDQNENSEVAWVPAKKVEALVTSDLDDYVRKHLNGIG